jgi:hypothetical protein
VAAWSDVAIATEDMMLRESGVQLEQARADPGQCRWPAALRAGLIGAAAAAATAALAVARIPPVPFPEPSRLVAVINLDEHGRRLFVSPAECQAVRSHSRSLQTVAWVRGSGGFVRAGNRLRPVDVREVSSGYFEVLGRPALAGAAKPSREADGDPALVVSFALWQELFGGAASDADHSLWLGETRYRVAGVMPPDFRDSRRPLDDRDAGSVWIALDQGSADLRNREMTVVARLSPGVSVAAAREELARLSPNGTVGVTRMTAVPFREMLWGGGSRRIMALLCAGMLAAAWLGLLVYASSERCAPTTAFSVRRALVSGLLRSGFTLTLAIAAVLALERAGAKFILGGVRLGLGPAALATVSGFASVTACLVARSARIRPFGRSVAALLLLLIGMHTAAVIATTASVSLCIRTVRAMMPSALGFDPEGLFGVRLVAGVRSIDEIAAKVTAAPDITSVGISSSAPFEGGAYVNVSIQPRALAPTALPPATVRWQFVDQRYFTTIGIRLLNGSGLSHGPAGTSQVVVNRSFELRLLRDGALGSLVTGPDGVARLVVGVVADVNDFLPGVPPPATVYAWHATAPGLGLVLRARGQPMDIEARVGKALSRASMPPSAWLVRSTSERLRAMRNGPLFVLECSAIILVFVVCGFVLILRSAAWLADALPAARVTHAMIAGALLGLVLTQTTMGILADVPPMVRPAIPEYLYPPLIVVAISVAAGHRPLRSRAGEAARAPNGDIAAVRSAE